jgi:two-component system chemotaxis response regulator CheY
MKILIVDDSQTMRTAQRKILEGLGPVRIVEAADGFEALGKLSVSAFDLALIDWTMPKMDGITLVSHIRKTDKKTRLIMVSTESEKTRILEAIGAGVNNYVIKPFTGDSLIEKVKVTLSKVAA